MNVAATFAPTPINHSALTSMIGSELRYLFDSLPASDSHELRGDYKGHIYGLTVLQHTPEPVRRIVRACLDNASPWYGKRFIDGNKGINLFGCLPVGLLGFKIQAPRAQGEALRLLYGTAPFQELSSELKRLEANLWFGRLYWRGAVVLYFTLET